MSKTKVKIKELITEYNVFTTIHCKKYDKKYADSFSPIIFIPSFAYCTDNAAMIAITGYYNFLAGKSDELDMRVSAKTEW